MPSSLNHFHHHHTTTSCCLPGKHASCSLLLLAVAATWQAQQAKPWKLETDASAARESLRLAPLGAAASPNVTGKQKGGEGFAVVSRSFLVRIRLKARKRGRAPSRLCFFSLPPICCRAFAMHPRFMALLAPKRCNCRFAGFSGATGLRNSLLRGRPPASMGLAVLPD